MTRSAHHTQAGRLLASACMDFWLKQPSALTSNRQVQRESDEVADWAVRAQDERLRPNGLKRRTTACLAERQYKALTGLPKPEVTEVVAVIDPERVRRLAHARASLPGWPRSAADEEHDLWHRLNRVRRQGTDQAEEWLARQERRVAADSKEAA